MEIIKNLSVLFTIGILSGLLYWVGFFHGQKGVKEELCSFFHTHCERASILTFKGDDSKYLCIEAPSKFKPKKEIIHDNI